jgi:superfamily II DNA or RNA helicase/predicted GIY-YIG superfamily endonuclease
MTSKILNPGQILTGTLFNEPMRVETVRANGPDTWIIGLVGTQSERFRSVTLTSRDIEALTIFDVTSTYDGDGRLLRLGLQAHSLGIAYEFDPYFGLSISRVDPLPHQLEAIYDYLLKLARVRFLLADDAGAGKTIMAGLLIRELKLRGLADRTLIVCPANLTFQWQRELNEKFDEKFKVLKGGEIRDQFGINQWLEQKQVITSLDLAKRSEILPGLRQVHWDLTIVDEAHRMSAFDLEHKTLRYRLGELLRDASDHLLLLTATPHKGDPINFSFFLQLLDQDAYADVRSIREAMNQRRAPFYLRRTKEAMVYFPERRPDLPAPRPDLFFVYAIECEDGSYYIGQTDDLQKRWQDHVNGRAAEWTKRHKPLKIAHFEEFSSREEAVKRESDLKTGFGRKWLKDLIASGRARQAGGTWVAEKIFTKRIPHTVDFQIDGAEFDLYRDVTRFVKQQSAKAAAQGDDPRARAVGFLMSLYQRRLASSTHAMRHSLENRAKRLEVGLKRAHEIISLVPPDLPDPEEIEEMEDYEREKLEKMLDAITLAANEEQIREETDKLKQLAGQAQLVEDSSTEAKLSRLKDLLHQEGFFDHPEQRLLLFTEFKDTLDYLMGRLKEWGFKIGCIHGGMKSGFRDQPGTRLYTEQQFKDGDIQVLVATEAAGEGINLQCCHILFNYDIPWNPNRLEQRMGRIHRYGQKSDCLIFNFVATNTIEGKVLQRLLEKLQEIRDALDDDAVFNVVGEILPAAHIERVLRDYYAGRLGDADLEDRLLKNVDEKQFRAICQNALEGLASKKLNLEMLVERRARAQERRVVPETIARFMRESADYIDFALKTHSSLPHTFDPGRTPTILRNYESQTDWKLPPLVTKYPRFSTDRDTAETNNLEWVTPGHPLFEALRRHAFILAQGTFGKGACFYSLQHDAPARLDFYRARVVDGLGLVIHERLFVVELTANGEARLREPSILGNFSPVNVPENLPSVATLPEATAWLNENGLKAFLEEVRTERLSEIDRIAVHVELSLTELLQKADEEIGKLASEVERKAPGAEGRLAQAETRHSDLLSRRERRRLELDRQRALSLQSVERITSVLILPHPERKSPEVRRLQPDSEVEATAMQVAMEYEKEKGRQVHDVHEKNFGYDLTSLDLNSGELRLIEVKGIGESTGNVLLTPNEKRVAEDRRDCYWLYVVTDCKSEPQLQGPIKDPARLQWHEVKKVDHYYLSIDAVTQPMQVREGKIPYGDREK